MFGLILLATLSFPRHRGECATGGIDKDNGRRPVFDLFLSYHWRDREPVEALARVLRDRGLSVFLDRWYLVPGQPWPQELEETLSACRAVAVCLGPGPMGPWQQRETNFALDRQARQPGFPVIPILLPGAEPALGFLSQNTWVDLREGPANFDVLQVLVLAACGERPGPYLQEQIRTTIANICPYRGLQFFREEDATFFFGRAGAVETMLHAMGRHRLVALVGASGSGKSSVARAGLIPAFRKGALGRTWEIATLVPTDRPLHALSAALMPFLEPELRETERLVEINRQAEFFAAQQLGLRDVVRRVLEKQLGTDRLLLVVDQWEELYTLADPNSSARFIAEILDTTLCEQVSVVLALRGDFFGHVLANRLLADRLQDAVVHLGPMNRKELEQAILAPAAKLYFEFAPGLVPRILDDVGDEPGNLPLLEFVLRRLWENRLGSSMRNQDYEQMGGLRGALAQHADHVYSALSPIEQYSLQRLFLLLVRPSETSDTRRRATLEEIGAEAAPIVQRLAEERLLVTSRDLVRDHQTVEVCHEALIRHWSTLRGWVDADREFLLWRERLRAHHSEWDRAGRPDGLLLREPSLQEAEAWHGRRGSDLTEVERGFIAEAQALQKKEMRRERQRVRNLRALSGFLLASIVGLGWFFFAAQLEKGHAEDMTRLSVSRLLTLESNRNPEANKNRQVLLAIAAIAISDRTESRSALQIHLQRSKPGLSAQIGQRKGANSIALSPTGAILASTSADNAVLLWDVPKRTLSVLPLKGHRERITSVAFSTDGSLLASSSIDGSVIFWDLSRHEPMGLPLRSEEGAIWSLAFDPSGRLLATAGEDKTVTVWDLASRTPFGPPLKGHEGRVLSVAFSADGKLLASGSADKTIRVWDVTAFRPVGQPIRAHDSSVASVAFGPDREILASASSDGSVRLWDLVNHEALGDPLTSSPNSITNVAFSPDGRMLASPGLDRTVILWDTSTRKPIGEPLRAVDGPVTSIAFSADGKWLAAASLSGTIMIWDVDLHSWHNLACSIANRNLSRREWREAIGEAIPFKKVCPDLPEYAD
jgi:WD40 repeat protein